MAASMSPEDYKGVSEKLEALTQRIQDTVTVHVLRKYGYTVEAALFDDDPAAFAVRREVGRRLMNSQDSTRGSADLDEWSDRYILKTFGASAFKLLQERLAAMGLPSPQIAQGKDDTSVTEGADG